MPRRFSCPGFYGSIIYSRGNCPSRKFGRWLFPSKNKKSTRKARPLGSPPAAAPAAPRLTQRHADVGLAALSTQQHFERTPNIIIII